MTRPPTSLPAARARASRLWTRLILGAATACETQLPLAYLRQAAGEVPAVPPGGPQNDAEEGTGLADPLPPPPRSGGNGAGSSPGTRWSRS